MGGVVNLIARRPTEPSHEFIVNRSSRGETDAVAYLSQPFHRGWGGTLVAGGHWHEQNDIDGDGWADLPGYHRAEIRPRVFWDNHGGSSVVHDGGRNAGVADGWHGGRRSPPGHELPYRETLDTGRYDFGIVGRRFCRTPMSSRFAPAAHGMSHDHAFGDVRSATPTTRFWRSLRAPALSGGRRFVAGAAIDRDAFSPEGRAAIRLHVHHTRRVRAGRCGCEAVAVRVWQRTTRPSQHIRHLHQPPRVRPVPLVAVGRPALSIGTGFFPTSALTEETEAAGLSRLIVRGPLQAETGDSASFDVTRTMGPLSATATLFASRIHEPAVRGAHDRLRARQSTVRVHECRDRTAGDMAERAPVVHGGIRVRSCP